MYKQILLLGVLLGMVVQPDDVISVKNISSQSLHEHRELYIKYWSVEFAASSSSQVGVCDLSDYLHDLFDEEQRAYEYHDNDMIFVQATSGDDLVGYLSCDIRSDDVLYVRQFALASHHQQEVFDRMLLYALDQAPYTLRVSMVLKNHAQRSITLAQKLGFAQDDFVEGLDDAYARHYEMICMCRHMTAWLDDEQDNEGMPGLMSAGITSSLVENVDYLEADAISIDGKLCDYPEDDE